MDLSTWTFDSAGFLPHGHCFLWSTPLLWTFATSDALIGMAYYSIPVALWYFVRHRTDTPFSWVFVMFAGFIFACGTTHFVSVWNLWQPHYWLDAALKAATAAASLATAVVLWPLMPRALAIPNQQQLRDANARLKEEIDLRRESDARLKALNEQLEARIAERTAEIAAVNEQLEDRIEASRAASRSLSEEKEHFRLVVESAPNGVLMVDEEGRIVLVNRELERAFGYRRNELIGAPVETLVPVEVAIAHTDYRNAYIAAPEERSMGAGRELLGQRRDGTRIHVEVGLSPLEFAGETFILATVVDITERKRAEKQLASERNLLKTLVNTLPHVVYALDSNGRYTHCNQAHLSEMSVDDERQVIGKTVYDLYRPEIARALDEDNRSILSGRVVLDREEVVTSVEGNSRHFVSSKVPLRDHRGTIVGLVGIRRDVTNYKRNEEYQRRAQKLEALGTLASGVAHDFNNVLLAISGNVRLAIQDLPEDHPVQHGLSVIASASTRAADLVRGILAFARQNDIARSRVEIPDAINEAVRLLRSTLPVRVTIKTVYDEALPAVSADSTQIVQVVMNLGTNAAHAIGGRSGTIEFRVESVYVTEEMVTMAPDLEVGRYIRISAMDDGHGMDNETVRRIFDPFFTTKAVGEGSGLGLSVVHGIVRNHGGSITVYSVPGKGTTFNIYLPAAEQGPSKAGDAPTLAGRGNGEVVLLVDDESALVDLGTRMLKRLGYVVRGFVDADDALADFVSSPARYDLVVTDLSMPGMSGFEFAARVMCLRPDLPVVLTSGYVSSEDTERAKRLGISAVILKPNSVDELARALDTLLRSRHQTNGTPSADPHGS